MSKEEKEKKAQEQQNESLADSKKIDLYINNQDDQEQGISIMNVFSRLKQRFHLYAFVMISTLLLGLLVPTLMYTFKDKKETAVAVLGFDYEGASEEKTPNGNHLEITTLKSSYVVQNAIENVTLSKEVNTAQVIANIKISRPLTDETRREKEIIDKLEEAKNNGFGEMVKNFTEKYRDQYFIYLNNGFSNGGHSKVTLSSDDLSHLLSAIMSSYNDYFIETYQDRNMPDNQVATINETKLDYLEILDDVSASLSYLADYCQSRADLLPGFQTKDGVSFSVLKKNILDLQEKNVGPSYADIYLKNIYKDKLSIQSYYERQKREAELDLSATVSQINTLQESIDNYPKGSVVVQQPEGASTTVPFTDPEKNRLELELAEKLQQKSALEEQISILADRLDKLEHDPEATQAEKDKANADVQSALVSARKAYSRVNLAAAELFASNAYKSKYMHFLTSTQSEKFSDNLKTFAIGAGAGLFLGLFLWVADAFILEFRAVKKANEAREAE